MRRRLPLVLAALVLACGPATSGRGRTPSARTVPAAAFDSLAGPWVLRNIGRPRTQVVTLSAVLRSRVDTVQREDTLASQTVLEWSLVPDATPRRAVGMVRAFSTIVGSDSAWQPVTGLPMPVTFAAEQPRPDAQLVFITPADTACDARAAVVQTLRETWLTPPASLTRGTTWQDSTTYPLCRDGIILRVESRRSFRVEDAIPRDGILALRIHRETVSSLAGRGLQFGDSIVVTGSGRSTATLDVSLDGAAILAGSGSSELRLQLQGRRRTQELVQHGALIIRAP